MNNCAPIVGLIVIEYSKVSPASASVAEAWNIDVDVLVFSVTFTSTPATFVSTGALLISVSIEGLIHERIIFL